MGNRRNEGGWSFGAGGVGCVVPGLSSAREHVAATAPCRPLSSSSSLFGVVGGGGGAPRPTAEQDREEPVPRHS